MELITAIFSAIPSVGFPVAIAVILIVFIFKIYTRSEIREDKLHKELEESRKVNAQAIETLAKYIDKLDAIKVDTTDIKLDITKITAKVCEWMK